MIGWWGTWRRHWPEYCIEAALLGLFLASASLFAVVLGHPRFAAPRVLPNDDARRALMGLAMGLTCVALVYSPWGRRSGAHMNPAVTLAFASLGKVSRADVIGYVAAQFVGAIAGVASARAIAGPLLADPAVHFVATVPGATFATAWFAEFGMSFVLLSIVLAMASSTRGAPFAGLAAGALVATYIALEAPISGMSLNPARSFGSALFANDWRGAPIYWTAPPLGMLAAALARRAWVMLVRDGRGHCAKLCHLACDRCIFCGQRER
ncbi:MAG: aquaporin [Phycisphaerales bacterium]